MVTVDLIAMLLVACGAMLAAGVTGLLTGLKIGRMQGLMDALKIAVVENGAELKSTHPSAADKKAE
jgi:hypothetical protein